MLLLRVLLVSESIVHDIFDYIFHSLLYYPIRVLCGFLSLKKQVTLLYLSQLPVHQLHDCAICNMCLHHTTVYLIYLVCYLFSKRVTLMQTIDFLLFLLILNIKLLIITCEYSSVQMVCLHCMLRYTFTL